jgi:hypothetical protein
VQCIRDRLLVNIQSDESTTLLHRPTPFACSSAGCSNRRVTYDAAIGVGRFIMTILHRAVARVPGSRGNAGV